MKMIKKHKIVWIQWLSLILPLPYFSLFQVQIEEFEGPDESWPIGKCSSGWEYDLEDFHTSVTVEFDWVCEQAWIPALSHTIFFFGAIPGMLFFGWFSDTIGRLPTIMCSNILAMVTGVLTPFITGHLSFFALRFAMGLAFNTFFTAPHILGLVRKYYQTLLFLLFLFSPGICGLL